MIIIMPVQPFVNWPIAGLLGQRPDFVLASHNDFIITQYSQVKDLISLFVIYDSDNMENNYLSRAEHLRLLDYIFSKKKEAAVLELKTHLDRADRTLLELTKKF